MPSQWKEPSSPDPYLASFVTKCTGCRTCRKWIPPAKPANPFIVKCAGCGCYASRHIPSSPNSSSTSSVPVPDSAESQGENLLMWDGEREAEVKENIAQHQVAIQRGNGQHQGTFLASTSTVAVTARQTNQHIAPVAPGRDAPSTSAAFVVPSGGQPANQAPQQTLRGILRKATVNPDTQRNGPASVGPREMNQGRATSEGEATSAASTSTATSATSHTSQFPQRTRSTNKRTAEQSANGIPSGYTVASSTVAESVAQNPGSSSAGPSKRKKKDDEKCPYAARGCPKLFGSAVDRRDREKHVNGHQTETSHKCSICGFSASGKSGLNSHAAMHERAKK